jgi:hypothetical protein
MADNKGKYRTEIQQVRVFAAIPRIRLSLRRDGSGGKEAYRDMGSAVLEGGVLALHDTGTPIAVLHRSVVASFCTRNWAKTWGSLMLVKVRLVKLGLVSLRVSVWLRGSLSARNTEPF